MTRSILPLAPLVFAMGCVPNNAELTSGGFAVFLSHNTSLTVKHGKADLQATTGDTGAWWNLDCRSLGENDIRLDDPLDICNSEGWPPTHEAWLTRDAYHVQAEDLAPWRGEAVMTSEGDVQITFHHQVTGGEDMRFAFVVDPAFQPRTCQEDDETGAVGWEDIDGDWLTNWSDDTWTDLGTDAEGADIEVGDRHMVFLNSNSYQFNPSELDDYWSLPLKWRAGYADAKFGEENFAMRTARYGEPSFYTSYESEEVAEPAREDLFYVTLEEDVPATDQAAFNELCDRVMGVADEVYDELELVDGGDRVDFRPAVHCNGWRMPDGRPSGLDAWAELHYNWVIFDQDPADMAVGEPLSGEFNLVFDGESTQSRLFIQGAFTADAVKSDRWTADDVMSIKLEENQTVLCGEQYGEGDEE